jgi:hypothetical protein
LTASDFCFDKNQNELEFAGGKFAVTKPLKLSQNIKIFKTQ